MEKITTLFTYLKKGTTKEMVCINGNTFISAAWLTQVTKVPTSCLKLLVGSSISVIHYTAGEVMEEAKGDKAESVCTDVGKIVKECTVELSFNLMCAMLKAA